MLWGASLIPNPLLPDSCDTGRPSRMGTSGLIREGDTTSPEPSHPSGTISAAGAGRATTRVAPTSMRGTAHSCGVPQDHVFATGRAPNSNPVGAPLVGALFGPNHVTRTKPPFRNDLVGRRREGDHKDRPCIHSRDSTLAPRGLQGSGRRCSQENEETGKLPAGGIFLSRVRHRRQARKSCTTLPWMSVSRWWRPWNLKVSRVWSIPRACRTVAWKSWTCTGFRTTL